MNYYNKKCLGCGHYLTSNKLLQGYTPKQDQNIKYCMRCFKLIHYKSEYDNLSDMEIKKILNKIDVKNNFVIVVVDLFNIKNSLLEQLKNNENVLYIINKYSCFPKRFCIEKTIPNIKKCFIELEYKFIDVILYDCYDKKNINRIWSYIEQASKKKIKTYVMGRTNAGKSSFINTILKIRKNDNKLASSPFKNTTLDLLQIKVDRCYIIDTPGFENNNSITSFLDNDSLYKIFKSKFNSSSYSILYNLESFVLEGLIGINILEKSNDEKSSITIYKYQNLKFLRCKNFNMKKNIENKKMFNFFYNENMQWELKTLNLDETKKYTLFLSGIGFIVIKNIKKIQVYLPNKIELFLTKNFII